MTPEFETGASVTTRKFETGATRDTDKGKLDYEGFFSPLVLEERARYMHKHREQSDGQYRESDNWQKGIPRKDYMKSAWRHFKDWWTLHRGYRAVDRDGNTVEIKEAICALMFNAEGYLHELLREEGAYSLGRERDAGNAQAAASRPHFSRLVEPRPGEEGC